MKPFFFNTDSQPLYGVYHPPAGKNQRSSGVLLCPPIGHEHMQSYWAYKQLAIRLTRLGFPVLRFDYFATGNSAGDTVEGDLTAWLDNIQTARNELQRLSSVQGLVLVGLRLGAALAARVSASLRPQHLILWDPVISGMHYLTELGALHRAKLDAMHRNDDSNGRLRGKDILGYLYGEQLLTELTEMELTNAYLQDCGELTILSDQNNPQQSAWLRTLQTGAVKHQSLPLGEIIDWQSLRSMEAAILPGKSITAIATLLRGAE